MQIHFRPVSIRTKSITFAVKNIEWRSTSVPVIAEVDAFETWHGVECDAVTVDAIAINENVIWLSVFAINSSIATRQRLKQTHSDHDFDSFDACILVHLVFMRSNVLPPTII